MVKSPAAHKVAGLFFVRVEFKVPELGLGLRSRWGFDLNGRTVWLDCPVA